jgi:hypothetical protein
LNFNNEYKRKQVKARIKFGNANVHDELRISIEAIWAPNFLQVALT